MTGDSLSDTERQQLLSVARAAIASHLRRDPPRLDPDESSLRAEGLFVTLRERRTGNLRGCIGQVEGVGPVVPAVRRLAVASATKDPRFPPVVIDELPGLEIEISILSSPEPIAAIAIEVGRHGLLIVHPRGRGLLLPQVAVEQKWDRETFLKGVSRKAGLPADAWRDPVTELYGFTATVLSETLDLGSRGSGGGSPPLL